MSKTAFNITVVLVDDDNMKEPPTLSDLMGGLMVNELEYYGQNVPGDSRTNPIIYLTKKKATGGDAE